MPGKEFSVLLFNNSLDLGSSFWDMPCLVVHMANSNNERLGNDVVGLVELSAPHQVISQREEFISRAAV
jgi:hypothetical protein